MAAQPFDWPRKMTLMSHHLDEVLRRVAFGSNVATPLHSRQHLGLLVKSFQEPVIAEKTGLEIILTRGFVFNAKM